MTNRPVIPLKSRLLFALGGLCVLSIALLYGRLYFNHRSGLYSRTPVYQWQAQAFLEGRTSLPVDFSCAGQEMILYRGHLYYYYGPLPSLIHAGFILLSGKLLGRPYYLPESVLTFVFVCGLAGVLFMAFARKAQALGCHPAVAGAVGCVAGVAGCALSILFSIARYRLWIFEEAALYSSVLASMAVLAAYVYLLGWYNGESPRILAAMGSSLACAGALLCRPNFATFPVLLAPLLIIPHLPASHPLYRLLRGPGSRSSPTGWGEGDFLARGALYLAAPAAGVAFLLIHNYVRFDKPFEFGTRYLLIPEVRHMRAVVFASDILRAPFRARLLHSIQGYLTGFQNPLFFPNQGPLPSSGLEQTPEMQPPFTFQRVSWILFPMLAALGWHLWRLCRGKNNSSLARLDLCFLALGGLIVAQHLWLSTYFLDIVYRYTLDMLPGFLALALAGLGFRGSYLPVTVLLSLAFVADAPHYLDIWRHDPSHYLQLGSPLELPRTNCGFMPIPKEISCGPAAAKLQPRARIGWDAAASCDIADSIFLVFSVDLPASGNRWRLEMLTDDRALQAAEQPIIFVQGSYFPLQRRADGQPGFAAEFTLDVDGSIARAFPVAVGLHPSRPLESSAGKLYSVSLAPVGLSP
jgi:hypothetical protein